jgi:outer membrane protein OmpA-like peptidoglycan-associated protein
MNHRQVFQVATLFAALLCGQAFGIEPDMPGSIDHPGFPRVEGTRIVGYSLAEYDVGGFVSEWVEGKRIVLNPEGKRTRIMYLGRDTQSTLQIIRNYQKALAEFGDYREVFACQTLECGQSIAGRFVWAQENRIPTISQFWNHLYGVTSYYKTPKYIYGTVVKDDKQYHISIFSAFAIGSPNGIKNRPTVHIEIVEEEDFESDLILIDAAAMSTEIAERGSIALYGIQFEFDNAALQANSSDTIAEVAKALNADPSLNIYIVGHTDGEGAHGYNQVLSENRAKSVVEELVGSYGVAAARLTAVGVGQVAPVASNDTEEGRDLNRRVAIVKR